MNEASGTNRQREQDAAWARAVREVESDAEGDGMAYLNALIAAGDEAARNAPRAHRGMSSEAWQALKAVDTDPVLRVWQGHGTLYRVSPKGMPTARREYATKTKTKTKVKGGEG